eukprot:CAMPEP_0196767514 /NCGR_PEP_ID=MMETSP1095-20130614/41707_1 /TAXON_ID=96789 ORGANISM="Chromulina nebulosa, Strain UTEXLB2642" /NCGR_SAMPLE_ID=MMETSP1095 /ASSEMBLY_ACC=CAM_ASM_000446 /LENGTH=334 /DNA_ID=CAMNT_0042135937 /DNA_START=1192 /DNA_END=2195 /DNA_ORIENTATION=-
MSPLITAQLLEMERLLRYMPHSITGEDAEDVLRIIPTDVMGDGCLYPFVNIDPSATSAAAPTTNQGYGGFGGASGGFGGYSAPVPAPITAAPSNDVMAQGKEVERRKGKEKINMVDHLAITAAPSNDVMAQGKEVERRKGKEKINMVDHLEKKQKAAMLEFTKTLWLQDATTSLKNLMQYEVAQQAFMAFLKTEYGEAQLEFFLEAQKLEKLDPNSQSQQALQIYNMFINVAGKGIGQQERTAATQNLWDNANRSSGSSLDPMTALNLVRKEAETTLNMLAFDAFPRFVKSKYCGSVLDSIKQQGGNSQIEGMLSQANAKAPQDADDWLNMFVA